MSRYVIIVAGGKGLRMGEDTPKQFLLLKGIPMLMYSIENFHKENENTQIVLVLNEQFHKLWKSLCDKYNFNIPHHLIAGGAERFNSVKNGLNFIFNKEKTLANLLIAIHDGARPLVSSKLINRVFTYAENKECVIPAIQSADSIRILQNNQKTNTFPREKVFMVQTPQVFRADILKKAFEQHFEKGFTDDASVVEKAGYPIHIIDGDTKNIKITYPSDIALAEYWLSLN